MLHRDKRNPGTFMYRLRLPNGITNAESMRFYADSVEPYGPDVGVIDITTRQSQLPGPTTDESVSARLMRRQSIIRDSGKHLLSLLEAEI